MYFEQYEDEKRAMQSYAWLESDASACLNRSAETCVGACPHSLPVALKLRSAHASLTFAGYA